MGNKIFTFELTYLLKRPAVYLYALAFSALAFVSFAGTAGFFDPPTPPSGTPRLLNSPHEINYILLYFNKFMLFLLPAIIGSALYRDYQTRMYTILYTFPLRKWDYLSGKFGSAFSLVGGVALAAGVAMWLAEWLPGLDTARLGPIRLAGYLQTYGLFVLPNLLAHGLLVFTAVLRWRNNYAGFAVVIGLLLLQSILENLLANEPFLIALTDPFGQNTVQYLTRYWTLEEQNSLLIPINGLVVANRLLWLALSGGLFWWGARWFSFSEMVGKGSKRHPRGL
jgi:ABC-2 type transport system permease protein